MFTSLGALRHGMPKESRQIYSLVENSTASLVARSKNMQGPNRSAPDQSHWESRSTARSFIGYIDYDCASQMMEGVAFRKVPKNRAG
jgi:hypothetical protein